jgi:FkbM family methyltransferase
VILAIAKYVSAVVIGLCIYLAALQRPYGLAIAHKAIGGYEPCPWEKLFAYPWTIQKFDELRKAEIKSLTVTTEDSSLSIERIDSPTRPFWTKKNGEDMDGRHLLAYILAEQKWITQSDPGHGVRPGDVVVDVGAHIGTFDDDALRMGASKVILVEPDPVNVECIHRNFKNEIADGRVVVVAEGAWDKKDTLEFSVGVANSGTGSLVIPEVGGKAIRVPVRPLDDILRSIGVSRVDFIKMDIEGAERHALVGAKETLVKWKPRLMMDSYHLPDDDVVLPRVIHDLNPNYRVECALCSRSRFNGDNRIIPYAVFYE